MPFFRGDIYQSGPGALASMLAQQGVHMTPGLLDGPLKLPKDQAQLAETMPAVARQYGLVVYPLNGDLSEALAQVAAGYPVLVRIDDGSLWWKTERYGVLVGYDRDKDKVQVNIGLSPREEMSFGAFASAWHSAGSWGVLIQAPNQLPAQVDRQRWASAAQELAKAGQEPAAARARSALGVQ